MKRHFLIITLFLLTACSGAIQAITPEPTYETVRTTRYNASTPSASGLGDPFYPTLGNGGYDVSHYDIALQVDPANNTIEGSTTLEAVMLEDLKQFNLDLAGLEVDSVTVNGEAATFSRHQMELIVTPHSPLTASQAFTVAVTYHGTPAPIVDGAIHIPMGWHAISGGTFVASEPVGAMTWFPCNNHWSDKATFTFRITVPDGYDVVANGLLESSVSEKTGGKTQVWVASDPMSTYLATVVIGQYEAQEQISTTGVKIQNYYPADTPEEIKNDFARTPEMIDFVSELIAPYPFENYGVVLVNEELAFALETQTRSLFGKQGTKEEVVAHELAHQWFGNSLTIATWQDLWLKEGFAVYISYLWLEHSQGEVAFEQKIQAVYDDLVISQYGLSFQPLGKVLPYSPSRLYGAATYQRGALTLHALRLKLGDEAFFKILSEFYTRYAGKLASTEDFIALAQEVSGRDLSALFDLWLKTEWMPPNPLSSFKALPGSPTSQIQQIYNN